MKIGAVIMVEGLSGNSGPAAWVQGARRAAARDLLEMLVTHPLIQELIVVSPSEEGLDLTHPVRFIRSHPGPIHVGRTLIEIVSRFHVEKLLYFGGGSAPLISEETVGAVIDRLASSSEGVLTNNQYASDWAGITPASALLEWEQRIPLDNMLGWVLSTEAKLPVHVEPASAASRLDIDTPTDLLALDLHPGTRRHLRRYLDSLPIDNSRLSESLSVLATPASHVFIAGRIGPDAWQAISDATRCWIRVLSEERGMVSSGRQEQGEVYSILADHISQIGISQFFTRLSTQVQAVFLDTRVLLAHHKIRLPASERFASDLGLEEQVLNPWLREFTSQARRAPIPIVLGGHGLLSGDMFAFSELL